MWYVQWEPPVNLSQETRLGQHGALVIGGARVHQTKKNDPAGDITQQKDAQKSVCVMLKYQ